MDDDELDPESLERGVRPGQALGQGSGAEGQVGAGETAEKKLATSGEILASASSRIVLGLLLFAGFGVGFWVAGVALHDPDTCWLLALGRYIVEHQQIPSTDPFSWTFAAEQAAGQHFVLYQWLTEVVFYLATIPAGLVTLLLLCAVTVSTAFLSIPMSFVVRREAPFVQSAWVVVLGMVAASFHTLARPEIFSYLWLAIFLQILHDARVSSLYGEKKIFPMVYILAPLMVLWANMHTGFVSGFVVLIELMLGCGLAIVLFKAPVRHIFVSALVALLGCLVAVLINPYGLGLYAYIPLLFNASINKYIIELQPVVGPDGIGWEFWPFILLCLVYLGLMAREGIAYLRLAKPASSMAQGQAMDAENAAAAPAEAKQFNAKLLACELLLCFVFGQVAIFNGLVHRRVASFATLILVGEVIALLGLGKQRTSSNEVKNKFWPLLDTLSLDLWKAGGIFEMAIVALCAVAGVALVSFRIAKPELPASSIVFKTPHEAVEFIAKHQLPGKLYNDQQFGDVLIYYLNGKPKVFIDTRFDMYGSRLVEEYISIHECQPGWKGKLDQRGIDWVFLLPDSLIAAQLKKDSGWQTIYSDPSALILQRKK